MVNRRGFFGWLVGLVSFGGVAKTSEEKKEIVDSPAYQRLLKAMRSMAPGGWSEDRWEQARREALYSVNRRAERFAQSSFQVYKEIGDSKRLVTPDDAPEANRSCKPYNLVELLKNPNSNDGWGDLAYQWSQQMDLTGQSLTWMIPNKLGIPHELRVIPTAIATPHPAVNPDYPDGYYRIQPIYPYGPFSSYPAPSAEVGALIPAQWMLRFICPHPLFTNSELDRSRWYTMQRIIHPTAVLNFKEGSEPIPEAEIERIKAEFEAWHSPPSNSGRLFVATPGTEIQFVDPFPFSMYETEAQAKRIGRYLTKHLAPFFGDDLIVEISV